MAIAICGSRRRAVRRPCCASLILARLPLLVISFLLLAHTDSSYSARATDTDQEPPQDKEEELSLALSSCADLPHELTEVHGVVGLVGDVICKEKRIIRVSARYGGEAAIVAHEAVHTKGVYFEVPSNTRLLFGVSVIKFEKDKDSPDSIFTVDGHLGFFVDHSIPDPEGSSPEDHHSILRLNKGASFETEGILRFTDSSLTVAVNYIAQPDSIDRDSKWAQRPRYENRSFKAPPQFSMFAPPFTTRETFGERLGKSLLYLSAGDELHWPSSMFSLDGTELTLSVDGSLLFKKHPVAAVDAYGEPVYAPLMTLVAADAVKSMSVIEKGQRRAGKAGGVEVPGRNGRLKVPGGAGGDGGSGAMLTVTDMGDVEVWIDGIRVLHQAAPNNDRTWRRRVWDRVTRHKRPKGDYEMHLVSDGFEVRLDDVIVWGVYAADFPSVSAQ